MADNDKDAEDTHLPGFSVVDSLTAPSTNESQEYFDVPCKIEKKTVVVKVEREAAVTNGELSASKGAPSEEMLFVVDGNPEESAVGKSSRETAEEVTEDEVTFVLDRDIEDIDDKGTQSTLIITTEDLLPAAYERTPNIPEEEKAKKPITVERSTEEPKQKILKSKMKREGHNYFWVSNITRHVKATDLKKFFSQLGKVLTAKVLTNGKNYFGYVSMNSPELAAKCVKQLNNTVFDGKKIMVSKDRPDLREVQAAVKVEPLRKRKVETPIGPKKEEKVVLKEENQAPKLKTTPIKNAAEEHPLKCNAIITDLEKKLDRAKADMGRYKWKVLEFQRRHEGMRKKCDSLERELKEVQFKLRTERRKLNQDREQFEKTKKLEQTRFDADRAIINKELDEVKKLREHLKEKIDEFKSQTKKSVKRRSRSPAVRSRNIRSRSPPVRNNSSSTGYRPAQTVEKKRKREALSRGRTPPPPPKLNDGLGKKRGSENSAPNRPYFANVEKRTLSHEYDYRHKSYAAPPDEIRTPWQNPFPKDPRRAGPSSGQTYPPDPLRYGGGYPFTSSSIAAPPRSYYPEFGKPYGSY